ncbi:MAG: hypothetical protein WCK57_00650 [Verrucomicrobiae bacterium]
MSAFKFWPFKKNSNLSEIPKAGQVLLFVDDSGILRTRNPDGTSTAVADGTGIPEAPSDSKQYARKNEAWVEVAAGWTAIDSTPITAVAGNQYVLRPAANGTTVTDPAIAVAGDFYVVLVAGDASTATVGGVVYGTGCLIRRVYTDSSWVSYPTFPQNRLVTVSATYAVLIRDVVVIATANSFTITLPTAVGVTGKQYTIINSGTGTITLATTSAQTISGDASESIFTNESFTVVSDGTNWQAI